jgi:hypothetical protein
MSQVRHFGIFGFSKIFAACNRGQRLKIWHAQPLAGRSAPPVSGHDRHDDTRLVAAVGRAVETAIDVWENVWEGLKNWL